MNETIFETPISILVKNDNPVVFNQHTPLSIILETMQEKNIGAVVIVDKKAPIGIFTERDYLRKVAGQDIHLSRALVSDYMVGNIRTLNRNDSLKRAIINMRVGHFRHLVVVNDDNELDSVLSITDVMDFIADSYQLKL